MRFNTLLVSGALLVLSLSSCKKEEATVASTPAAKLAAPAVSAAPAAAPATAATAAVAAPASEFSVESVPVSTANLPPFPFFKTPEGLTTAYDGNDSIIGFERHFFIVGKKLMLVEPRFSISPAF